LHGLGLPRKFLGINDLSRGKAFALQQGSPKARYGCQAWLKHCPHCFCSGRGEAGNASTASPHEKAPSPEMSSGREREASVSVAFSRQLALERPGWWRI
jgi:hypothetical protein